MQQFLQLRYDKCRVLNNWRNRLTYHRPCSRHTVTQALAARHVALSTTTNSDTSTTSVVTSRPRRWQLYTFPLAPTKSTNCRPESCHSWQTRSDRLHVHLHFCPVIGGQWSTIMLWLSRVSHCPKISVPLRANVYLRWLRSLLLCILTSLGLLPRGDLLHYLWSIARHHKQFTANAGQLRNHFVHSQCTLSPRKVTRGQSNLTKSASRGAHSSVRGHPRGSKVVPLNSWGRVSY